MSTRLATLGVEGSTTSATGSGTCHDEKLLLLAVTGYKDDDARLERAGFDGHLLKPPSMPKLSAFLAARENTLGGPHGDVHA